MTLGYKDPHCVEAKISACFRLGQQEEAIHRREKRKHGNIAPVNMADGSAHISNAYHAAQAAVKRTGSKRWQVSLGPFDQSSMHLLDGSLRNGIV